MSVIFNDEFCQLLPLFDSLQERAILQAKDSNISSWLSVLEPNLIYRHRNLGMV